MKQTLAWTFLGFLLFSGATGPTFAGGEGGPEVIEGLHVDPATFSAGPHGLGQVTTIHYTLGMDAQVTIEILDGEGDRVVLVMEDVPVEQGPDERVWTGLDDESEYVIDGDYTVRVVAEAEQGDEHEAEVDVFVDTTPPGGFDLERFVIEKDENGALVRVAGGPGAADPDTVRVVVFSDRQLEQEQAQGAVEVDGAFEIELDAPLGRVWMVPQDEPGNPGPAVTVPELVQDLTASKQVISPLWSINPSYVDGSNIQFQIDADASLSVHIYKETDVGFEYFWEHFNDIGFDEGGSQTHWNSVDYYNNEGEDAPEGLYRFVFEASDSDGNPSPASSVDIEIHRVLQIEDGDGETINATQWQAGSNEPLHARMYTHSGEQIGDVAVDWSAVPEAFGVADPTHHQSTEIHVQKGPGAIQAVHPTGAMGKTPTIDVLPDVVDALAWTQAPGTTDADTSVGFEAIAEDAYGNPTGDVVTYALEAGTGQLNATTGLFTPEKTGDAKIRAYANAIFAETTVQVTPGSLKSIQLEGPGEIVAGSSVTFTVTGKDANGNPVELERPSFVHIVPDDAGIHEVVHAVNGVVGTQEVTVLDDWQGWVGLRVAPPTMHVGPGGTQQFEAHGVPVDGALASVNATWSVVPQEAGTINATGVFEADPGYSGTAQITAHLGPLEHHTMVHVTNDVFSGPLAQAASSAVTANTDRGNTKFIHSLGLASAEAGSNLTFQAPADTQEAVIQNATVRIAGNTQDLGLSVLTQNADPDDPPAGLSDDAITAITDGLAARSLSAPLMYVSVQATESGEPVNGSRLNELLDGLDLRYTVDPELLDPLRFETQELRLVKQSETGLVVYNATRIDDEGFSYQVTLEEFSVFALSAGLHPQTSGGGGGGGQGAGGVSGSGSGGGGSGGTNELAEGTHTEDDSDEDGTTGSDTTGTGRGSEARDEDQSALGAQAAGATEVSGSDQDASSWPLVSLLGGMATVLFVSGRYYKKNQQP